MKRKKSHAIHIKNIVYSFFSDIEEKNKKKPTKEKIEVIWGSIVGELAQKHSKPISLNKEVLIINVDSPVWIYELQNKKESLLQALKLKLNDKVVKDIKFRLGEE